MKLTPGGVPPHLPTQGAAEKWRTAALALGSWSKTAQFCLMVVVTSACAIGMVLALVWLSR